MTRPFYIIGFMGTGKSSLKRYLEKSNHVIDLDEALERHLGMGLPAYFARHGESAFRAEETAMLRNVHADYIVTGGGIVERSENIEWMRRHGRIVALELPFELCWGRIKDSDRPLVQLGKRSVEALYERRCPLYAYADVTIDASLSSEAIACELDRLKEEDR
ncbi:shikimate kinase [Exiguobacterium sp. s142]|uniref:shikimate kinase n=1 Tax=Exiguobacterium sp. s142 TaxID=2751222 RepID=UPI0020373208|nr:shikimate kinase [Exiguobacterium sp. s142]